MRDLKAWERENHINKLEVAKMCNNLAPELSIEECIAEATQRKESDGYVECAGAGKLLEWLTDWDAIQRTLTKGQSND
tara:strand:+ start:1561 stop:1794 length:234 start_codon:yes stop_codon:yes gene_type:complete